MLIVLTGSDPNLCDTLAGFLEKRSFRRVTVAPNQPFDTAQISTREHCVLVTSDLGEISRLKTETNTKIIFAGPLVDAARDQKRLLDISDVHFTSDTEETAIIEFVTNALSNSPRPSWDQYFVDIAHVVATRGNCMKRQVAAVVVRDRRVVATGYNGTPKGAKNCNEGGCERCNSLAPSGTGLDDCVCNHAEENAICQAAYHGISIKDATLYCTHSPCLRCAKLLINAGIREVVYNADYPMSSRSRALLDECGIICRRYP